MKPSSYHPSIYPGLRGQPLFIQPTRIVNRRRRRWPARILFFTLGLLAGWVLRGGGAWLP